MSQLTRSRPLWLLTAAAISLLLTVQSLRDPDVWWHLAVGREILQNGIPAAEPFSFVATHPWVGQQWLYEAGLARLVDLGGAGLASLTMGLVATAGLVMASLAIPRRLEPPGPWLLGCLLAGALVAGQLLGVRGQVITFTGVAAELLILARWREGSRRAPWALPWLLLLWCNLHAGFVVGLLIPLLALALPPREPGGAPAARRPLLLALGAAAAATLLTPAGASLYPYLVRTFTTPALTQHITEWLPPDFHQLYPRLMELQALALVVAWMASDGPEPFDMALAGGAFTASLLAQRNMSLFALVATPQLIRYGTEAWRRRHPTSPAADPLRGRRGTALLVMTAAASAGVVALLLPQLTPAAAASFEADTYPRAPVDRALASLPGQRLYTTYENGGYLAHRIPGGRVVFVYGESAIFGESGLERYLDIHLLRPGWPDALAREGLRHAVLPADTEEVAAFREVGWTVDCRDARSNSLLMSAPGAATGLSGSC